MAFKEFLTSKFSKKDGVTSVMVAIIMSVLFPLILFLVVDVNYYIQVDRKAKSIVDNMAASAASRVDSDLLASGVVEILYDEALYTIYEDAMVWFNLEPFIYSTNVSGVKMIPVQAGELSMLNQDLGIIELLPDTYPTISDEILQTSRIEFFIHTEEVAATYYFTDGQFINVVTPTVGVYLNLQTNGTIFHLPVTIKKIGMSEAFFDTSSRVGS